MKDHPVLLEGTHWILDLDLIGVFRAPSELISFC